MARKHGAAGLFAVALVALTPGCAHRASQPSTRPADASTATLFDFHSGPWVNLHHVLEGEALKKRGRLEGGGGGNGLEVLDDVNDATFADGDRRTWTAAVAFYATHFAERSFTFDDELAAINEALSEAEAEPDLARAQVPAELARTLESAMPIYRARFWSEHDRSNRAWIASVRPYVDRSGVEMAGELARLYRSRWPDHPFRVDVTRYATWSGAYTTLGPDHLTISGADPRNQPPACLEILLHESSHAIVRPLRDAVDAELARQGKSSRDLWHAMLFFTTGRVVERRIPGYVPYAVRYGLYDRGWKAFGPLLETRWKPYVDGREDFDAALRDVVSAL